MGDNSLKSLQTNPKLQWKSRYMEDNSLNLYRYLLNYKEKVCTGV